MLSMRCANIYCFMFWQAWDFAIAILGRKNMLARGIKIMARIYIFYNTRQYYHIYDFLFFMTTYILACCCWGGGYVDI